MWLMILRFFAGVITWLILILVNVSLLGVTLYCFVLSGWLGNSAWASSLYKATSSYGNPQAIQQSVWQGLAITAAVVCGIVFIITLLMISRIKIAIACIKVHAFNYDYILSGRLSGEQPVLSQSCQQRFSPLTQVASQAVGQMPSIMFYPIIPFILTICLVMYWLAVTGLLYTCGALISSHEVLPNCVLILKKRRRHRSNLSQSCLGLVLELV